MKLFMKSLVINAGSSSVKFQVFDEEVSVLSGLCEEIGTERSKIKLKDDDEKEEIEVSLENHRAAFMKIIEILKNKNLFDDLGFVAHRVLHGGEKFMKPKVVNDEMIESLKKIISLGPLHMPANIEGIELMKELLSDVPQVAIFDTAFHSTIPEEAYLYGVPYSWYTENGVRRYGFHGSSHEYVVLEALRLLDKKDANIINCHLGSGASVCATIAGKSIDTSMGMTPMEGNIMGTRCGNIDPGVILHMLDEGGLSLKEVSHILNKESGLKGISEITSDFRILKENRNICEKSRRAINVYLYNLIKIIGSYIGVMGGVDAITFTGGAGENAGLIREYVAEKLKFLGVELDKDKNDSNNLEITTKNSRVRMFVISTNEELQMARNSKKVLN